MIRFLIITGYCSIIHRLFFRAKFGCTTWEERLWVVGGYDRSPLQSTENFDIFQETWQEGPKLIQRRHSAPIVTTTDGLYVIGTTFYTRQKWILILIWNTSNYLFILLAKKARSPVPLITLATFLWWVSKLLFFHSKAVATPMSSNPLNCWRQTDAGSSSVPHYPWQWTVCRRR